MSNIELLKYVKFLFEESCKSMNRSTELEDKKYFEGKRNAYDNIIGLLENDTESIEYIKNIF